MNDKIDNQLPVSRYNYFAYYNNKKYLYKLNYEEKKRRDLIEAKHKEYYRDYWLNARWKEVLIKKNKINTDNKNEVRENNQE